VKTAELGGDLEAGHKVFLSIDRPLIGRQSSTYFECRCDVQKGMES
jgi:hypothetical protein